MPERGADAGGAEAAGGRRPMSERIEQSSWGRLVLSALVLLLLGLQVATHLPPSAIGRELDGPANQLVRLLGMEQTWAVFAPNPRSSSLVLEALVTFADGSTETWTLPEGPRIGSNLRYYRWRKWMERVRADSFRGLWRPTAEWVASQYADRPSPVVRVELIRQFRENVVSGPQPPWDAFTYFTLELDEEDEG